MANGRSRGARQAKTWTALPGTTNDLTADGTTLFGFFSSGAPFTVLRMLGEYVINPTSAPVTGDSCVITVGIAVVSSDAAALGSTAMPDPDGEPDFPWLYWAQHPLSYPSTEVQVKTGVGALRHTFDVRSMRKIQTRQSVAMVVEYDDRGGAPPVTVNVGDTRVLTGLH